MADYVIYDPDDTLVANRVTEYRTSANTPTDTTNYLKNSDVSSLLSVAQRYWKESNGSVVAMSQLEKEDVDKNKEGDKNFNVREYISNKLSKETWYHVDNGDGTYDQKVEETTYTYNASKVTSKTIKTFKRNGIELTSETWKYFGQQNKEIMKKQGE